MDFALYRESLGKYLFDGRPEVYFSTRLNGTERVLLELHEHTHWEVANASTYGKEQLMLAEAIRHKAGDPVAAELGKCLETSVEFSRLAYEGSALAAERSLMAIVGASSPEWNSLLRTKLYGQADRLFGDWLRKLPYSPSAQASIATNAAELCLNSVSILDATESERDAISARDPKTLRAADVRARLARRSPDSLLGLLSKRLVARTGEFVARLDAAIDGGLAQDGLTAAVLRTEGALPDMSAMAEGHLTYVTYEALRRFAEDSGAIDGTREHGLLQDIFQYLQADWIGKLLADELLGVPTARGIRARPLTEDVVRGDLDFFSTIYTVVHPPERDRATDIRVTSWAPVHQALRSLPGQPQLYLAITAIEPLPHSAGSRPAGSEPEAWYELSAASAVIAPHDDFNWKFGRSRYVMSVPGSRLREAVGELLHYNLAVAVPFDLIDLPTGRIRHLGTLPRNATVGCLLENAPFADWAREIRRLSRSSRTISHYYEIGPAAANFIITFGIADTATWFVYMPLSMSMRRFIDAGAVSLAEDAGHELAKTLDDVPMSRQFAAASFLICEQYLRNGL